MKTRLMASGSVVLMIVLAGAATRGQSPEPRRSAAPDFNTEASAVVGKYCVTCHNQRLKTAGLLFDADGITNISRHPEVWEKVVRKVRSGQMPPLGSPKPEPAVMAKWVTGLEQALEPG